MRRTPGLGAALLLLLSGCASAPPAPEHPATPKEPTTAAWYGATVARLAALDRDAAQLFRAGKGDEAAARIKEGEPLAARLLAVPRPTFAATAAASDLDELYGRMLLSNHHYGWAQLQFQKNAARWRHWSPATPETEKRLRAARDLIAECDRRMQQ